MVATSTPASLRAVRAGGGARKVKSLGAGVPRSVIAVSRLTTARSARRSTPAIGPRVVAGLAASRDSIAPSKWTSPPKARVTGSPVGSRVRRPAGGGGRARGGRVASAAPVVWVAWVAAGVVAGVAAGAQQRQRRHGQRGDQVAAQGTCGRWVDGAQRTPGSALGEAPPSVARRDPPCQAGSATQARVVGAGRAHRVAARRRTQDRANDVVGPRGHPGRPQQPAKAPPRTAPAPPLGDAYLPEPLGVGVQLGNALVAGLRFMFSQLMTPPRLSNTSDQSTLVLHLCNR